MRSLCRRSAGAITVVLLLSIAACASGSPRSGLQVTQPPASIDPATASSSPAELRSTRAPRPAPTGVPYPSAAPAPSLEGLVRPDGSQFHLADLAGHPTFVFFGYTHCPDICPATIGELMLVLRDDPDARVVFASIDPERDTPAFLTEWSRNLPAQFTPVTGAPLAVRAVADAWGVRYARVETTSAAGYSMSHTADVYLVDPSGRRITRYPFGTPARVLLDDLRHLPAA